MSLTASRAALLHIALQDLRAGKQLLIERLLPLADAASDTGLQEVIERDRANAKRHAARLDDMAELAGAPANLWMSGILDDAERDSKSHLPGGILDTALIGALRKVKAAEIVSIETAMALAGSEAPAMLPGLSANHAEDRAIEARLARLLGTIGGHIPVA
jgi:ferritin-like metal-binding protein YciE